jgi:hypothetical protein
MLDETRACAECGEPFVRKSKHERIYCNMECSAKTRRKRYRAKPHVRAAINAYERMRNKRRKSTASR